MAVGSAAGAGSLRLAFAAALALAIGAAMRPADAAWHPHDLVPTTATLAEVLAAHDRAVGAIPNAYQHRIEHWTYVNGSRALPVTVMVRGSDVRADVGVPTITAGVQSIDVYSAGRVGTVRWRADANGIAHDTRSDLQGDAIDRLPEALFPFAVADCAIAGETAGVEPAWVVAFAPARRNAQWFYIDKRSGLIVKSVSREGKVVITMTFDRFDATDGVMRARHWIVSDGVAVHAIDARVESVTRAPVAAEAVAFPTSGRRVFAFANAAADRAVLPALFGRSDQIFVDVSVDGRKGRFVLDSGTASITLNTSAARALPGGEILEHAHVSRLDVGDLTMRDVSVLSVPFGSGISGILGYDFFFGHIVHIDYPHHLVEIVSHRVGDAAFADPANTVIAMDITQGLPLAHAVIGDLASDDIALDTGSPRVVALQPFVRRFSPDIVTHWTRQSSGYTPMLYLEGRIDVVPFEAAHLVFGPGHFGPVNLDVNVPHDADDTLEIPFDGILGTDVLDRYDLWFDYDAGRLAMRVAIGT